MKEEPVPRKADGSVDWEEVRTRLQNLRAVVEQGWTPTPEEKGEILRKRARELAREPLPDEAAEQLDVVAFRLANERYGIESAFVDEVYPLKDLTPVPCTPPFVLGIINVRGRILSVIDLKKFFDLPEKGLGDLNKVIILKARVMEFGILADVIEGVRSVPAGALQQKMPTLVGIREEYLKGIAADRTVILDGEKLLSSARLVINEEITA